MPAIDHDSVEALPGNCLFDVWRIESGEAINTRPLRYIFQKAIRVAFEKRNIPVELNSESRSSLFPWCGLMAEEYF